MLSTFTVHVSYATLFATNSLWFVVIVYNFMSVTSFENKSNIRHCMQAKFLKSIVACWYHCWYILYSTLCTLIMLGHPYKILKHHCSCTTRSTFFAERVISIWNCLLCDTVDFSSLSAFKRTIERVDFSRVSLVSAVFMITWILAMLIMMMIMMMMLMFMVLSS